MSRGLALLLTLFLSLAALMPLAVHAADPAPVESRIAQLVISDGALAVNSRFALHLNPTLSDALEQGVMLTFRLDFELTRPRTTAWWRSLGDWFEPTATQRYRLSWHPLTRQCRVGIGQGNLYLSFARLDDALAIIGSARSWRVLPRSVVGRSPLKDFAGRIRLTLDTTRLPKPFQLNIIKSNDWALDSDWIPLTSGQGEGDD